MHSNKKNTVLLFLGVLMVVVIVHCGQNQQHKEPDASYLNLGDSAKYVGMDQCRLCHQDIYNSFLQTGMGQSFDVASKSKSSARFDQHAAIYDSVSGFYYRPYWDKDSLKIKEYRLEGKDTVYKRTEKINYIVGSGQHTNSHILSTNGYLHQAPATFYTQKKTWDLPPGFEGGHNSRFSRKIGLECTSCHNAYPDLVPGSENKYFSMPSGIDCERCHGPGSIHVRQKTAGVRIDTSRYIDYSIVNPGKLPVDLQFDVCQRCHLQGNAVLKKSFYDFRPGMRLSDAMTVFMPRYENSEEEFIMASHADRLRMSRCFVKSFKPAEGSSLRPYKEAMTCVTCHNPHVSVKVTGSAVFNNACIKCHGNTVKEVCSEMPAVRLASQDNCVSCHMVKSGSIDIPHVSITDHFIRKPLPKKEMEKIKKFIGLYAINEEAPGDDIKGKAYLNQYEKFEPNPAYLDSAKRYLEKDKDSWQELIHLYFLKDDFDKIIHIVGAFNRKELLGSILNHRSWSNDDAWTCYRIGEAYGRRGDPSSALIFYKKANALSPFNMEFRNKEGVALLQLGRMKEAKEVFEYIITEDSKYPQAYCNLGYVWLLLKDPVKAGEMYERALALDPDYEQAMMNKAGLFLYLKQNDKAVNILNQVLKKYPENAQARQLLGEVKRPH